MTDYTPKFLERYWSKVNRTDSPDGCWLWTSAKVGKYGAFWVNNKVQYAHRLAYEIAFGSFDPTLFVCHHCDTPLCCNPSHLFLGTAKDNAIDKTNKRRNGVPYGEQHPLAKLTHNDVIEIRRLWKQGNTTQQELADRFGISQSNLSLILLGKSWKRSLTP